MAKNDIRMTVRGDNKTGNMFRQVNKNLGTTGTKLKSLAGAARGFVGILAGGAMARSVLNIAKFDDEVGKLSRSLGITTEEVSKLFFAAERFGVGKNAFAVGMRTLIRATADAAEGMKQYQDVFVALGIDAQKLSLLPITEQLEAVADAFVELGSDSRKQDFALTLFGSRGGLNFLNLLEDGAEGLRKVGDELETIGGVTSLADALQAEEAIDSIANFEAAAKGMGRTLSRDVIPIVTELLNGISNLGGKSTDWGMWDFMKGFSLERAGQGIGKFLGGLGSGGSTGDFLTMLFGPPPKPTELKMYTGEGLSPIFQAELEEWEAAMKEHNAALARLRENFAPGVGVEAGPIAALLPTAEDVNHLAGYTSVLNETGTALERVRLEAIKRGWPPTPSDRQVGAHFLASPEGFKARGVRSDADAQRIADMGPPEPDRFAMLDELQHEVEDRAMMIHGTLSSAIHAGFTSGAEGAKEVFKNLLLQLASDFLASQLMSGLKNLGTGLFGGGDGGGFFASLFGGAKADGGPVRSGRAYLVGERGPEMFLPNTSGSIIPSGALAGAGGMQFNIDARGATPGVELRIRQAVADAVVLSRADRVDSRRRGRM